MACHVVLLRGINVGAHHRLPMAGVRQVLGEAGYGDVATYIQSGNIVLTSSADEPAVRADVQQRLEELAGFPVPTVVFTAERFDGVLQANPFTPEAPKLEHVVLLPEALDDARRDRIADLAATHQGPSRVHVTERAVYLDHPEGLLASKLAADVTALLPDGTARNMASMTAIAALAHKVCPS